MLHLLADLKVGTTIGRRRPEGRHYDMRTADLKVGTTTNGTGGLFVVLTFRSAWASADDSTKTTLSASAVGETGVSDTNQPGDRVSRYSAMILA